MIVGIALGALGLLVALLALIGLLLAWPLILWLACGHPLLWLLGEIVWLAQFR